MAMNNNTSGGGVSKRGKCHRRDRERERERERDNDDGEREWSRDRDRDKDREWDTEREKDRDREREYRDYWAGQQVPPTTYGWDSWTGR
jgi:hypothetical protein